MTKLSALDKLTRLLCCANHLACPDPGNAPGQKQKTESTSGLLDENRPSSNKPSSSHQDEAEDRLGVIYQAVGDVINLRNNRAPISESQPSINALTEASDNVFDEGESATSPSVPNSQYARNEAHFMRDYYRRKHEESLRKQPRRSMKPSVSVNDIDDLANESDYVPVNSLNSGHSPTRVQPDYIPISPQRRNDQRWISTPSIPQSADFTPIRPPKPAGLKAPPVPSRALKNPPSNYSGSQYSNRTANTGFTGYGSPGPHHYSYATTPSPGVSNEPQELKYIQITSTAETSKKTEPEGVKVDYVQIDQKRTDLISGKC